MGKFVSSLSHGMGDHVTGHHKPNIAQNGAPKRVHAIEVHPGMRTKSKSGGDALSGHHASAIDALTGMAVVPGRVTSTPGFGNAGVQSGHPLAKAPASKNVKPVAPAYGQRSRSGSPDSAMHEIGQAMLAEAFAASGSDDRQAHGRKRDGSK